MVPSKTASVGVLSRLDLSRSLPEVRDLGGKNRGLAAQTMQGLSRRLVPNLATRILGRLGSSEDYARLGADLGMNRRQIEWAKLNHQSGMFIGQVAEGDWREPFVFKVPMMKIPATVDDQEAQDSVKPLNSLPTVPATEYTSWEPSHLINVSGDTTVSPFQLTEQEIRYLKAVIKDPGKPSSFYSKMTIGQPEFIENPEPRCPCILLTDASGSMAGDPIRELNKGLTNLRDDLQKDHLASRRVEVAIVSFGGDVQLVQDFTTVDGFTPPQLRADGETPMGEAIMLALDILENRKSEYKANGIPYYRPWVWLLSDGAPTDSWQEAARRGKRRTFQLLYHRCARCGYERAETDCPTQSSAVDARWT